MRTAVLALVCACGGGPSGSPPGPTTPQISLIAPPAAADDVVVAQVNGRPVWGSCVAAQARRGAGSRQAALEQCIAFELLAQTAEHRGEATDREVIEATRTAMVSQLIATQFEDKYQTPADLGHRFDAMIDKNLWRMHRPELRGSAYARLVIAKDAPAEAEQHAHAVADAIYAALANESGLLGAHLADTAKQLAARDHVPACENAITTNCLMVSDVPTNAHDAFEKPYADALFAIPEIGRVSPPVRTSRGWDVIVWTDALPPKESTRDELAAEAFPELRRTLFATWVNDLIKSGGHTIAVDPGQLDEAGP